MDDGIDDVLHTMSTRGLVSDDMVQHRSRSFVAASRAWACFVQRPEVFRMFAEF